MTVAGVYRTSSCAAAGHAEFAVTFAREVPVAGLERVLLEYFEEQVKAGAQFRPGQTVQLGWATFRLTQRSDGTLGVLEPDFAAELKWTESVDQSLMHSWAQGEVLRKASVVERADAPRQAFQVIVCERAWTATGLFLGRTPPSGPSDSGWFIGCDDEGHSHEEGALTVVPAIEVAVRLPRLVQFLALPVGADVIVGERVRLFVDEREVGDFSS